MIGQPLPGLVVAEVEQFLLAFFAKQPSWVICVKKRARRDALRLEPDDDLLSTRMGVIANWLKPARETVGIHLPRAGVRPA